LTLVLFVLGASVLTIEGSAFLTGKAFSVPLLVGVGVVPLVVGRVALARGRSLRRRIESGHRERYLLEVARRQGGRLDAEAAARAIDASPSEAQKLIEGLVKKGHAELEVGEDGSTFLKLDERRLLRS
jgi:hypothetical protein